jgi:hypothetical protein
MFDLDPFGVEDPCDQEKAMTLSGILLAAHHRNAILAGSVEQATESGSE